MEVKQKLNNLQQEYIILAEITILYDDMNMNTNAKFQRISKKNNVKSFGKYTAIVKQIIKKHFCW